MWNPDEGLHLITASDDDGRPVLRCWDLRSSTTTPLLTAGRSAGIFAASWCPQDSSRLLTCGKDNRTFLWDLTKGQVSFELPPPGAGGRWRLQRCFFGGAAGSGGSRRYDGGRRGCRASRRRSFDRRCNYSMVELARRAPKYALPQDRGIVRFGGKLVVFGGIVRQRRRTHPRLRPLPAWCLTRTLQPQTNLRALHGRRLEEFLQRKEDEAATAQDKETWSFMRILFEQDARQHLLRHLGFAEAIAGGRKAPAERLVQAAPAEDGPSTTACSSQGSNAADVFGAGARC